MWKIIIENGMLTLLFGLLTSVAGIIITNNYNKKKEQREKKYILTNEVYQKLVSIYNGEIEKNNHNKLEGSSVKELLKNAFIDSYQNSAIKNNELQNSYLKIKYILKNKMVEKLDLKFKELEKIKKEINVLEFSDIYNQLNGIDIDKNDGDKIQRYRIRYIEETRELENIFLGAVEKELQRLLK